MTDRQLLVLVTAILYGFDRVTVELARLDLRLAGRHETADNVQPSPLADAVADARDIVHAVNAALAPNAPEAPPVPVVTEAALNMAVDTYEALVGRILDTRGYVVRADRQRAMHMALVAALTPNEPEAR